MIIAVLIVLGLCFGSFVNALAWRLHEKEELTDKLETLKAKKQTKAVAAEINNVSTQIKDRSISTGRSMCTDCNHSLAWYDLVPVISWVSVGGKCRYCSNPISWQYPLVEILTAVLLIMSYLYWPQALHGQGVFDLIVWLVVVVAFMALSIYDFRWMILPNVIVYPLIGLTLFQRLADTLLFKDSAKHLLASLVAALIGGGIFYVLYQLSGGNWIGGGDVKIGFALGLLVGAPLQALLLLMLASIIGLFFALPAAFKHVFKRNLQVPFGPCLMIACLLLVLFGTNIVHWYLNLVLS
ncbi:MAG: prepilin peptidase [Patescibacteria group bacterium]|nr:prepilin peptidase [Patescibacteria group bacterium]